MKLERIVYFNTESANKHETIKERLHKEQELSRYNLEVLEELKEKELKLIAVLQTYKKSSEQLKETNNINYFCID